MITLYEASKVYNERSALNKVSFKIRKGEVVGLLGLNGAGKTTLMRLMVGLIRPTIGLVQIDSLDPFSNHLQASSKIGYLPENNPLYLDMLVGEYLSYVALIKNQNKDEFFKEILLQTNIQDKFNAKIGQLSRGYRQRVGLAAALLGDPEIIILDEPTSGLDPIEQEKIRELILKLSKNKTILFSSHNLSEVGDIASRLIMLSKGRLAFDGDNPQNHDMVEKLFKKYVC